jgi:hypothetical protein
MLTIIIVAFCFYYMLEKQYCGVSFQLFLHFYLGKVHHITVLEAFLKTAP